MYVIYDIETTGTNIAFDQILQFAAILTDRDLNEIERFETRCRILPWVVPSPTALLITNTSPRVLDDLSLPTFFEMMHAINRKLGAWKPAIFVGYNSMRFDEPFLQRALWQALLPPYQTVTNGSARFDLLPLVRTISYFRPEALKWPTCEDGSATFRLDHLAPVNGFSHQNAHDALADVEATLFIARRVMEHSPDIWNTLTSQAAKSVMNSVLAYGSPVFVFEHVAGQPSLWAGQRVDRDGTRVSRASVARLDHDWKSTVEQLADGKAEAIESARAAINLIGLNKSPVVFTISDARRMFGITLASVQLTQSAYLSARAEIADIVESVVQRQIVAGEKQTELEQRIFEGYPGRSDEARIAQFQEAGWLKRARIARTFEDERLRSLATRAIFVSAREALSVAEVRRVERGISRRLFGDDEARRPWRNVPDAIQELSASATQLHTSDLQIREIQNWLNAKETYRRRADC